ncbi:MAG: hypothetical protein K6T30_07625, partial [Alicyclobacillus sp.]|nr:hypothetical protein [Alicyclobacillus sp.]
TFHSHPAGSPRPSLADHALADWARDHLILYRAGNAWNAAWWRIGPSCGVLYLAGSATPPGHCP